MRRPHRSAFTLVEVAAVALLLAIVAGAVAWTFSKPIDAARATDVRGRIMMFDATARQAARSSGRQMALTFDLHDGTLVRYEDAPGETAFAAHKATLPAPFRIADVRIAGNAVGSRSMTPSVRCSAEGRTLTYAVHVVGPELDVWLVFAGLTGQVSQVAQEAEVDAIFEAIYAR